MDPDTDPESETVSIREKTDIQEYLEENPYFVMAPDYSIKMYKSLRDISREIFVNPSTISKKIRDSLLNECYCMSKTTKMLFYIRKL